MADEEKKVEGQSPTSPDAGAVVEPKPEEEPKVVDYEAEYRKVQAEKDKLQQEHESLKSEYETVKPYLNFGEGEPPAPAASNEDDELPVTRKELKELAKNFETRRTIERVTDKFLQNNPDLRPYEDLVANNLLTKTDPKAPIPKRLLQAAKIAREFVEAERKKGADEEAAKKTQKEKEIAAASGLGSAGATAPKKPVEEKVETPTDYVEKRKAQSRARMKV
jgi:hypothetical protein